MQAVEIRLGGHGLQVVRELKELDSPIAVPQSGMNASNIIRRSVWLALQMTQNLLSTAAVPRDGIGVLRAVP